MEVGGGGGNGVSVGGGWVAVGCTTVGGTKVGVIGCTGTGVLVDGKINKRVAVLVNVAVRVGVRVAVGASV